MDNVTYIIETTPLVKMLDELWSLEAETAFEGDDEGFARMLGVIDEFTTAMMQEVRASRRLTNDAYGDFNIWINDTFASHEDVEDLEEKSPNIHGWLKVAEGLYWSKQVDKGHEHAMRMVQSHLDAHPS